jgi:hypothetical protein
MTLPDRRNGWGHGTEPRFILGKLWRVYREISPNALQLVLRWRREGLVAMGEDDPRFPDEIDQDQGGADLQVRRVRAG